MHMFQEQSDIDYIKNVSKMIAGFIDNEVEETVKDSDLLSSRKFGSDDCGYSYPEKHLAFQFIIYRVEGISKIFSVSFHDSYV